MSRLSSLALVSTLLCGLSPAPAFAQEPVPASPRVVGLQGEVAATCSRTGWRPLALDEVAAGRIRLAPGARAELRQGGAEIVASLGARLEPDRQGLRLERGRVVVSCRGPAYRVATSEGALVLRRGRLEVAALTSGVFARVQPQSQAELAGAPLSARWSQLSSGQLSALPGQPGLPAPPTWPDLPVALRDFQGYLAERVEVVGLAARVELRSGLAHSEWRLTLRNPHETTIEAVTPLPLPWGAAVTDLWVGPPGGPSAYVVRGRDRKGPFAVGGAKQLAHLEWSRGDVARLSVAPLTSEVSVTLRSVEPLSLEGGRYRFSLPLGRPAWRALERVRCELKAADLGCLSANRALRREAGGAALVFAAEGAGLEAPEDFVVWEEPARLSPGQAAVEVLSEGRGGARSSLTRLRPNLPPVQVHPERVFLVDTSLAPTPEAFAARVQALETLLDELPEGDAFALLAFDATSARLTPGFVRGVEAKRRALARLRARGPLGACDIEGGLLAAAELCRARAPGQLILISGGPASFGQLRAEELGLLARERFLGWSISALALGELRSEAQLEAIVAGRGLILAAPSRGAGAAAFRLAHALEFLEARLEVGLDGALRSARACPPGGQIVLRRRGAPASKSLELGQAAHAPRRLPLGPSRRAPGVAALVERAEALAEPDRELLAAFRREVRGELAPLNSRTQVRVLLPQAALSAGSPRYALWEAISGARFEVGSSSEPEGDPRSDGDPLWGLDLDWLVPGRADARARASAFGALALETYYRVDRATEGKADEPLSWPKEGREVLPAPRVSRRSVAPIAPPAKPLLRSKHSDLHFASRRGAEIEAELAAPPYALEALYLERAPRRPVYSECSTPRYQRRYLTRVVNRDGSWGSPPDLSLTCRALQAFLGNGHTHRFGGFKRTVNRAYLWLRRRQRGSGSFGEGVLEHALATATCVELYFMSRDFKLREPTTRALTYLVRAQNEDGSWGQGSERPRATSESLRALRLAGVSGKLLKIPGLAQARARALVYLTSITSPDGAVGPQGLPVGDEIDLTLTAEVALARVFAGASPQDPQVRGSAAHVLALTGVAAGDWYQRRFPRDGYRLLWAATELMFQVGGESWPKWAKWLQRVLLPHQLLRGFHDGSWNPPRAERAPSPPQPEALAGLLANPALANPAPEIPALEEPPLERRGEATSAALSSLCAGLAQVDERERLVAWRESAQLPPASRACAGARLALAGELRGEALAAAEDWFAAWQAAGQSPAADRFLLRATALWERERGGGHALLRVLAAPCRPERFTARLEVLLDVLLRQPERARRELVRGLPARRPFERRVRLALLAALTGLEQDPLRQVALLEDLAALVGREAPWERLATAYLSVGDPRGFEQRRALVVAGQQDTKTLERLTADALEHLPPGERRQRAATSALQIHWSPSDEAIELLETELGQGAGLDLRLAALESSYFSQGDLAELLVALERSGRRGPVERALAIWNLRETTFEAHEERRLRGIHFDGSPELQAAFERVLENDLEVVVAWENEASEVEFKVEDAQGLRVSGVVDREEGRTLFLLRRQAAPVRVRVELAGESPPTRVHLEISHRRGGKRVARRWVFMLTKETATRSLAE